MKTKKEGKREEKRKGKGEKRRGEKRGNNEEGKTKETGEKELKLFHFCSYFLTWFSKPIFDNKSCCKISTLDKNVSQS